MPWKPMRLRDARVLARCDESGALRAQGGRVEILYRPGGKPYQAAARNLEPADGEMLPDDAVAVSDEKPAERSKAKKTANVAHAPLRAEGDEWIVYADGACSGNPGPAGLGVVVITKDGVRELSEFIGDGTNNIAELTAILRALELVDEPSRAVRVYTDSSYAIGLLSKGWKAKKNVELVAEIRRVLAKLDDVVFVHVPGHAGVFWNERADVLATDAISARSTSGWQAAQPHPTA
jgi:ribonuclease HI